MGRNSSILYVGAQIGVWSFTIRYVMVELGLNEHESASYYLASLVLFTASRFICTALLSYVSPVKLLTICASLAALCSLIVATSGGLVGVFALVAISSFMSLMFPTIFGLAVKGLGNDTKIAGSGLIMAILGGAVITAVQGAVSDLSGSIHYAFLVPMICFLVVLYYSFFVKHTHSTKKQPA